MANQIAMAHGKLICQDLELVAKRRGFYLRRRASREKLDLRARVGDSGALQFVRAHTVK